MVTLTSQSNSVKFSFTDNDHYLFGTGEIEVPINSLYLVLDESDMVTFSKIDGDPFISFRADNSNLGSKSAIETFYKNNMVGSTGGGSGSGVTPTEVQQMIDASLVDYPTNDDLEDTLDDYYTSTEIDSAFNTVQGELALKADGDDLEALDDVVTAHTANTNVHTTTQEKAAWNAKQDALVSGTNIKTINNESILGSGNITIQGGGGSGMTSGEVQTMIEDYFDPKEEVIATSLVDLNGRVEDLETGGTGISSGQVQSMIDGSISGKADTSAVTAINSSLTAHTNNAVIHTTSQEKAAWDAKANMVTLTQAEYDQLVSAGTVDSGTCYIISDAVAFDPATKQDVLSAGTGIQISSANVISVSGMQETLVSGTNIKTINNESILGSGNITIQGGGGSGATYSAGTNISINTANTISCTLNASNASGTGSLKLAPLQNTNASGAYSVAAGYDTVVSGNYSFGAGRGSKTNNYGEAAFGFNNKSNGTSSSFGNNSGNTLFSVGNGQGTSPSDLHNAFEIRQNGDIYVNDGTNDVRLQDTILALGGLKFVQCTQAEYDALVQGGTVDSSTIYFITNVVS